MMAAAGRAPDVLRARSGAIIATMKQNLRLLAAAALMINCEAVSLWAALAFFAGPFASPLGFMACLLCSRIGLYGFILGEVELRQRSIPAHERGQVNGFASALNQLASLVVYALATLFAGPADFAVLVYTSVGAITLSAASAPFSSSAPMTLSARLSGAAWGL